MERPIIFGKEMVNAILCDCKTQTRRVILPPPERAEIDHDGTHLFYGDDDDAVDMEDKSPYGGAGDLLYVREAFAKVPTTAYAQSSGVIQIVDGDDPYESFIYRGGWDRGGSKKWKPSIHMPKRAARIWLEVLGVSVERVQDIDVDGIKAEGVELDLSDRGNVVVNMSDKFMPYNMLGKNPSMDTLWKAHWWRLWDSINRKRGYGMKENPFVWVVKFNVISKTGKL